MSNSNLNTNNINNNKNYEPEEGEITSEEINKISSEENKNVNYLFYIFLKYIIF
jgi:hypothetical protein